MNRGARPAGGVSLGAAWSLVYIGASRLGTFGLSVLVARALGPELAGTFGVALQVTTFAAFVGVLNVNQALAQRVAEVAEPARKRRTIGVGLAIVLAGTGLTGGVLGLGAPWIAVNFYHDAGLAPILSWCAPLAVATGLFMWADGSLQGLHGFRPLAVWGSLSAVVDLVVSGLAALAGLPALLAARTVVRIGAAAAAWRIALRLAGPGAPLSAAAAEARIVIVRRLLRFGGLSFLAAATVVLGQNLLRILLVRASGLAEAGHFQVADTIGQALLIVPSAAGIAFLPAVARDHSAGSPLLGASILRAARRVTGFNLPLCLAVVVLGPFAVRLIFGSVYEPAGETLQWLAVAYALAGLVSIAGPVLLGRAELGSAMALNLLWFVVLCAAMLLGADHWGAAGAAIALVVAYVFQLVPCAVIASRRWKLDPRGTSGPFFATLLAPGAALFLLRAWPGAALASGTLVLALAGVLFLRWAGPELVLARDWGRRGGGG